MREPFDKAGWIQQKRVEREHAYETIDQMSELIAEGTSWLKLWMDVQSRFPMFSVSNALLIAAQKPNAVDLADFNTWHERGASIKAGESSIVILERGNEYTRRDGSKGVSYNSKRVFDISQTTAKTPPETEINRDERLAYVSVQTIPTLLTDHSDAPGSFQKVEGDSAMRIPIRLGKTVTLRLTGSAQEGYTAQIVA